VPQTIDQRLDQGNPDADNDGVVTENVRGFDAFRTYNFSTSLGTTIYGTVKFNKDAKIKAIRHVIRPQIGYSYGPAFDEFYDELIIPGNEIDGTERLV